MIKKSLGQNQPLILLSLILLILPFLDGGISQVGQIFLFITPLSLILFILAKNKLTIKIDSLFWLSITFIVIAFISLLFTASFILSLSACLRLLALFVLFHLSRAILNTPEKLKMALWPVFFAGVSLSLLSLFFFLPFVIKPSSSMNLFYANHGHNHLAEYLPFVLLPSLSLFLTTNGKKRLILGILTGFFFIMMLLTFSRTTFLFFPLIAFGLFKQLKLKSWKKRNLLWFLSSLPILLALALFFFSSTTLGQNLLKIDSSGFLAKKLIKPIVFEGRFNYWREAWLGFLQRPFFGWGWGTFRLVAMRFQNLPNTYSWYTHNFYLQTLMELGILGFLILGTFIFKSFSKAFSFVKKEKDPLLIGIFWALIFSACQSILDFGWQFPAVALTFLVFLGALTNERKEE